MIQYGKQTIAHADGRPETSEGTVVMDWMHLVCFSPAPPAGCGKDKADNAMPGVSGKEETQPV